MPSSVELHAIFAGSQRGNHPDKLGFLVDHQNLLKGHRVEHHHKGRGRRITRGVFDGIDTIYGLVGIGDFGMLEEETRIAINREGITITAGSHPELGSLTVLFEEPQRAA